MPKKLEHTLGTISGVSYRRRIHTRVNLHDLRKCQPHFIPVHRRPLGLQRIPLEVYRLEVFLILELSLDLLEARKLVIRPPEFF